MNLKDRVNAITTRQDLASFLRALSEDLEQHKNTWENQDLAGYLEALAAWCADMDGYYLNRGEPIPETPAWRTVAELLLAAKYYG